MRAALRGVRRGEEPGQRATHERHGGRGDRDGDQGDPPPEERALLRCTRRTEKSLDVPTLQSGLDSRRRKRQSSVGNPL